MRSIVRTAAVLVCLSLILACSVEETLPHPSCSGGRTSAIVVAQSVPGATLLPCFEALPAGWEIKTVTVTDAGTTVVIDSDRAGFSAASLRYLASCDTTGATETPSDYENTERFEAIRNVTPRFQADRFYRFEGGCLWWHFDFDIGVPSAMSVELGNSLLLLDRQQVNDNFRADFVDEDL